MRGRHGMRHSSVGLELGMHLLNEFLKSSNKARWRIGNDIQKCTLCGKCEIVCHTQAITVNRHNRTWTLNNRRCSQCLICVMKCPSRCLGQVRV